MAASILVFGALEASRALTELPWDSIANSKLARLCQRDSSVVTAIGGVVRQYRVRLKERESVALEVLTLVSICQPGGNQLGNSIDAAAADSNSVDAVTKAGVVAAVAEAEVGLWWQRRGWHRWMSNLEPGPESS
ncbi:hypothetical protein LWI29_023975 [Acer saccharum]|uniref:Uncharacterized protein n=1 Tax=Acer saccharum TaxID=4024 RepID=A0AA39SLR1_ACESA|nr:hypothetical protein LWI29_015451 [Acer saccharum]KAK0594115.1 hypothetical protein LWI29_023975 [Acer saccharum]